MKRSNRRGGTAKKIMVLLLAAAMAAMYTFGSGMLAFASESASDIHYSGKYDSGFQTHTVTADWIVVKQGNGNAFLWTKTEVDTDFQAAIENIANTNDKSLKNPTWEYGYGFSSFTPFSSTDNWGTYGFADAGDGKVTVSVYDRGGTTYNRGRISHICYGTYKGTEKRGSIWLTKTVVNGAGVSGTFYFKLVNADGDQFGDLKSIAISNGIISTPEIEWQDVPYGDYTIIETDKDGTALEAGDKTFGKELVDISSDNKTKVTLSATSGDTGGTAADPDPVSILWSDGGSANLFGAASRINLLAFQDADSIIDVEGNVAVGGDFTSQRGMSVGYGGNGTGRAYSDAIALLVGGNLTASQINTKGHVAVGGTYTLTNYNATDYTVGTKYSAEALRSMYGSNANISTSTASSYLIKGPTAAVSIKPSKETIGNYFGGAYAYMSGLQDKLAALTVNGTMTSTDQKITLTGTDASLNVFEVDLSGSNGAKEISINCPATSTVIVNVKGTAISSGNPAWGNPSLTSKTIFNFTECTKLTMTGSTAFFGSVLAPGMILDVNGMSGNVNGNTIVKSLLNSTTGFECHESYFSGKLPGKTKADVTNTFKDQDSASVQFSLTKSLTGRSFKTGDAFTFDLYDGTDTTAAPIDSVTTTAQSGSSQTLNFDAITYLAEGTHVYTVVERIPAATVRLAGLTYDTSSYTITVTVSKDDDGKLQATYTVAKGTSDADAIEFVNPYRAAGSALISLNKVMTGRNLLNGECTFEMVQVDAAGASVAGFAKRTVSNTLLTSGNISFGAINYTEADAGKTYYYKVTEVAGSAGGVTYDSRPIYATVRVGTDNGDGTLAASTVTYTLSLGGTDTENTFRNSYSASGSITLGATKALTGAALADGEFTFTLTQVKADGTAMANGLSTTAVNKGGSVTFPAISYTGADAAGVYYYRIAERNDGAAGIRYDSSVYTAKVTVTDDGAGKLNTSVQYFDPDGNSIQAGSLPAFSNRYVEGEATITVGKNLIGRTLGSEQFAFTLTQTDANHNAIAGGTTRTASNDRSGNVTFSNIKYTAAGTYYYMITEDGGGTVIDGIRYDASKIYVTVTVDSSMAATVTYPADKTFDNEVISTSASLMVYKSLTGLALQDKAFSFTLTETDRDGKAKTGGTSLTATNDLFGNVSFAPITYTAPGTYYYSIKEVNGGATIGGISYDGMTVNASVTVTRNNDGTLTAAVSYPADRTFNNTYFETRYVGRSVTKVWEDNDNGSGKRPAAITVHLMSGASVIDTRTLSAVNNWSYSWSYLPKYDANGLEINYTVVEDAVDGYVSSVITGIDALGNTGTFTLINTANNEALPVEKTVTKIWDDNNNSGNARPQYIEVQLYADGAVYGDVVRLSDANNWTYTWTNLPEQTASKTNIVYTVGELTVVPGYEASYSADGFTITNSTNDSYNSGGGGSEDVPEEYNASPQTDDSNGFALEFWSLMMIISALGAALLGIRKNEK